MMSTKRILCLTCLILSTTLAASWVPATVPDPKARDGGYVADPDKYLSTTEIAGLNERLRSLETAASTQFAIVILSEIDPSREVFEFGVDLFRTWGLGSGEHHTGLLLLIVMQSHDWRFITGYGLEAVLPDALLHKLGRQHIVPRFQEEAYARGLEEVIDKISLILKDDDPQALGAYYNTSEPWWNTWIMVMWVLWGIPFLLGLRYLVKPSGYRYPAQAEMPGLCRVSEHHVRIQPREAPKTPVWGKDRVTRFIALHLVSLLVPVFSMQHGPFLSDPVFNSLAGFYLWLLILLLFIQVKKKGHIVHQAADKTERFFLTEKANRNLWAKALFFPFPFLFIYLIHRLSQRGMKKGPFSCFVCKAEAAAASKETAETALGPAKSFENSIGSSDIRVFQCPAGHVLEIPFPGRKAGKYSPCSSCGTRAVHQTADRTLTAATYSSTGTGQKEFTCRYCQTRTHQSYTIPVKTRESSGGSGSSGGSSSSGSSSWGGGSTGGGGAGGKW